MRTRASALLWIADRGLGSGRVARVLERVIAERGRPDNLRSNNGPEFTSRRMLAWAGDWKVGLVHIQPGRPMQNGHVESFHGRLRDDCLLQPSIWPLRISRLLESLTRLRFGNGDASFATVPI